MPQPLEAATGASGDAPAGGRFKTFRALRNRNYRLLWLGQVAHSASIWMEQVVRPLLTLALTDSPLQVGLVVAVRMAPMLIFGVLAGAVADRYDKRIVLFASQSVTCLMHLVLGLLVVTHQVEVWHIMLTGFLSGAATAFNHPARQSMVPRLVSREELLNALALNQAAVNFMRIGGGGLAGVLLIVLDFGPIYLLNGLIYVFVLWTTALIAFKEDGHAGRARHSLGSDLLEGFRYVGQNREVLSLMAMALILYIFGMPYQQVFIPLIAVEQLQIGRPGVGWMLAFTGVGATIGSLTVAAQAQIAHRWAIMLGALAIYSLSLITLAQSSWFVVSMGALVVCGAMTVTYMAINNVCLLEETPARFHGRVMSMMSLDRGLIPIGAILAGALAETLGPRWGLTIMASVCLILTGFSVLLSRTRRPA